MLELARYPWNELNMSEKDVVVWRGLGPILADVVALGLCSCSTASFKEAQAPAATTALRQRKLLDADWLFHRGEVSASNEVISASFDDRGWQHINLPHDYVLDGSYEFSEDRDHRTHGYLPVEVGWYRKHHFIPESARGKILRLNFDGAFRDSEVWLNGQFLGRHLGGYTPFSYDVTRVARPGAENLITVRLDPRVSEGH